MSNELSGAVAGPEPLGQVSEQFIVLFQEGYISLSDFATYLLVSFLVIDVFFFGIAWALNRNPSVQSAFVRVLLAGLVILFVSEFSGVVTIIQEGFGWIADTLLKREEAGADLRKAVVLSPEAILRAGYESGFQVLHQRAVEPWPKLFTMDGVVGMGIIINFALIAIQLVCTSILFYGVALLVLIFIPISVYSPARSVLPTTINHLLAHAARVLGVVIVSSVLMEVWAQLDHAALQENSTLQNWLVPFLISLTFAFLGFLLPRSLASLVEQLLITIARPEWDVFFSNANTSVQQTELPVHQSTPDSYVSSPLAAYAAPGSSEVQAQGIPAQYPLAAGERAANVVSASVSPGVSVHSSNRDLSASASQGLPSVTPAVNAVAVAGGTLSSDGKTIASGMQDNSSRQQRANDYLPHYVDGVAKGPEFGKAQTHHTDKVAEMIRAIRARASEIRRAKQLENVRHASGTDNDKNISDTK